MLHIAMEIALAVVVFCGFYVGGIAFMNCFGKVIVDSKAVMVEDYCGTNHVVKSYVCK